MKGEVVTVNHLCLKSFTIPRHLFLCCFLSLLTISPHWHAVMFLIQPTVDYITNSCNIQRSNFFAIKLQTKRWTASARWTMECNWCSLDLDSVVESRWLCYVINLTTTCSAILLLLFPLLHHNYIVYLVEMPRHVPFAFCHEFLTFFVTDKVASVLFSSLFWTLWSCFYRYQILLPTHISYMHCTLHIHRQMSY